ncbi:DUF4062 domain-containing protein [Mesorhizobium sp. WSM3876]|uniref:DUF4062 domain-containing protein n=1 Tax=Mesorhizobium sp. WSM3876 TaxID=422277 RepID=UPI000BAF302D|nr:DUF4062 domain-containing protein [Mesorhizobium sp. WSM3876]PBB85741.1 hypothetical protein CK216_16580 [Mesorhizobium sp. WSM3876]
MAYSVRHQVFVSSTFTDLKEERAEVIQAVWELDCIPTGMEAFVASNESQWDVIKRVIDECDYYVLIIGGRYGSLVTDEGISYTEKEYRYAKKSGIPVLAFVHAKPDEIPVGKTEKDDVLRKKLEAFRSEVMNDYPVKRWSNATELGGFVSRSLIREIRVNPRPGWIRNDGSSPIALLEQVNRLTEENQQLRDQLSTQDAGEDDGTLASGSDEIALRGTRLIQDLDDYDLRTERWEVEVSWDDIFRDLGPALINETTETELRRLLARFHVYHEVKDGEEYHSADKIDIESWNEVLIQLRALGYIDLGVKKRGVNDKASYWRLTPKGDRHLVGLMARRKKKPNDADGLVPNSLKATLSKT